MHIKSIVHFKVNGENKNKTEFMNYEYFGSS